jgi:hypothetical protein
MTICLSVHAEMRIRQRGLKSTDVLFVCQHGTETKKGFLLTNRDAAILEAEGRYLLRRAQELKGILVPVAGNTAKTAFRTSRRQQCKLL